MDLYDILSEGRHTPLTPEEIAELFHAGRFGRDEPCRQVAAGSWRTLDELFPLLKYDAAAYSVTPEESKPRSRSLLSPLESVLIVLLLGSIAFFAWERVKPAKDDASFLTHRHRQASVMPQAAPVWPANNVSFQPTPYRASVADRTQFDQDRLAAEQRQREQTARDQAALADRMRAEAEQRAREAQKAAGRDVIVPLDQYTTITDIGGSAVSLKVHDNDVTTFDVWINGQWLRGIVKQKGATHSGNDETLIYRNGGASLYYVWEISGRLDSCLLRVREN